MPNRALPTRAPLWLVAALVGAALALLATRTLSLPPPLTGEEPLVASLPALRAEADRLEAGAAAELASARDWEAQAALEPLLGDPSDGAPLRAGATNLSRCE